MRVEELLNSYNEIKTKVELLEIDIADCISLGSKNIDDPLPGKVSARSNTSVVERQAVRIEDMQAELRMCKRLIEKINILLNTLSDEERKFIQAIYFEHKRMVDLSIRYHTSLDTMYKRKTVILKKLEKYYNYVITTL